MAKSVILRARDINNPSNPFQIKNFVSGGWKVRNATNTGWINMTPNNTFIRNPDHDEAIHDPDDENFPKYLTIYEEQI